MVSTLATTLSATFVLALSTLDKLSLVLSWSNSIIEDNPFQAVVFMSFDSLSE